MNNWPSAHEKRLLPGSGRVDSRQSHGAVIRAMAGLTGRGGGHLRASTPQEDAMPRKSRAAYAAATVLVLVGIAGTLWVPIYARSTPKWGAFPFFYWYQLIWVPAISLLSWLVYLLLRTKPAPGADTPASAWDGREDRI